MKSLRGQKKSACLNILKVIILWLAVDVDGKGWKQEKVFSLIRGVSRALSIYDGKIWENS